MEVRFVDAGVRRVAVLTLDRPPVNAMSFAYSAEIVEALASIERDEACSALIVCGAGGTFSAGADVGDFASPPVERPISVRDVVAAIDRSTRVTLRRSTVRVSGAAWNSHSHAIIASLPSARPSHCRRYG